jgi:4-hydroxymandelate synthase
MYAETIDHIEYYVGDARQTAYYLCTAFGFRITGRGGPHTGLVDQHSLLLEHGDVRVVLTSGLVPGHPACEYIGVHGDGVASVAFGCADVTAAYARLVERGARGLSAPRTYGNGVDEVVLATVSGFGDVSHRLVQRRGECRGFLPGAIEPVSDGSPAGDMLRHIDHLAVCLPTGDLATTARYYHDVFGFAEIFEEYIEVGTQAMNSTVLQSPSRQITFTFLEPDPTRSRGQIDDFLDWHAGAGVQHVAFLTDDIVAAVRMLSGRGVNFAVTPGSYYDELASRLGRVDLPTEHLRELGILVDQDHWGQMYQIFTQSMHVRRTHFLELIERHGALTFGSSNIKALYEAKERELTVATDGVADRAAAAA